VSEYILFVAIFSSVCIFCLCFFAYLETIEIRKINNMVKKFNQSNKKEKTNV